MTVSHEVAGYAIDGYAHGGMDPCSSPCMVEWYFPLPCPVLPSLLKASKYIVPRKLEEKRNLPPPQKGSDFTVLTLDKLPMHPWEPSLLCPTRTEREPLCRQTLFRDRTFKRNKATLSGKRHLETFPGLYVKQPLTTPFTWPTAVDCISCGREIVLKNEWGSPKP